MFSTAMLSLDADVQKSVNLKEQEFGSMMIMSI